MTNLFRRIGGPNAFSLNLWMWLSPVAIVGTFLSAIPRVDPNYYSVTLAFAAVSYFSSGPVFYLARRYWSRHVSDESSRPFLALFLFALGGLAVSLSFSFLMSTFVSLWNGGYWQPAASRSWVGTFWSAILSVALDARARFTSSKKLAQDRISQLESLMEARPKVLEKVRANALTSLRKVLLKYLKSGTSESLTKAADQVSRDVSRKILASWDQGINFQPRATDKVSIAPTIRESFQSPVNTSAISIIVFIGLAVQALIWLSPASLLNAILTATFIFFAGASMRRVGRINWVWNFVPLVIFACSNTWLAGLVADAFEFSGVSLVGISIGAWILACFISVQFTLDQNRQLVLLELTKAAQAYEWNWNKLQQELWLESNKVARIMHGDVQARLRAAAIQFDRLEPKKLDQLRDECMSALNEAREHLTLEAYFDQAAALWDGSMEIIVNGLDSVGEDVSSDPDASSALVEIMRESLSNAARHAQAETVFVRLRSEKSRGGSSVVLTVSHEGVLRSSSSPGLGTMIVRELSSYWSLTQEGGNVVLEATVPYFAS